MLSESFHPSKRKKGTGKGYRPTCMRMHLKAVFKRKQRTYREWKKGLISKENWHLEVRPQKFNENHQEARKMGARRQTKGFSTRNKEKEMKNWCQQGLEIRRTDQILN